MLFRSLPAILSVVLALGVQRMALHKAVVKRLTSVETLGSALRVPFVNMT